MSTDTTSQPTEPPIREAQNSDHSLRLLAAERRLYSDAKKQHAARISIVSVAALAGIVAALTIPAARTPIGIITGTALLILGVVGGSREKRKVREAASVQEEFDTRLFGLPWSDMLTERPSPSIIAAAARRYDGPSVEDWYPDTATVGRPLDVLICQQSNLGWGVPLHRAYAATLVGILITVLVLAGLTGALLGIPVWDTLVAIYVPLLPVLRELAEMIKGHFDNAQSKASAEGKVNALWRRGLGDPHSISEADCRAVQDCLLNTRRTNASIPDWFDRLRHSTNEANMRATAEHLIAEARQRGPA